MEIWRVPQEFTPAAWADVAPLIAPVVDMTEGRHTMETTFKRIWAGDMQAWVALSEAKPVMACVTQIALYPAQRWLQIPFCGGSQMRAWLAPLVDAMDTFAYDEHCAGVEIFGRGGWQRVLRRFGYEPSRIPNVVVKPLTRPITRMKVAE